MQSNDFKNFDIKKEYEPNNLDLFNFTCTIPSINTYILHIVILTNSYSYSTIFILSHTLLAMDFFGEPKIT